MRFDQSQSMRMGQHMKLAPHMIQSMEILQMSQAALEERIEQELESNATLEIGDGGPEIPQIDGQQPEGPDMTGAIDAAPMKVDELDARDDFGRLDSFEQEVPEVAENEFDEDRRLADRDFEDRRARSDGGEGDAKLEAMANTAARPESLQEQLQEQWGLVEVEESLRPLGAALIGYIEDDGYLRTPLAQVLDKWPASEPKPEPTQLDRALSALQLMLEPVGVAARNPRECLLLQIDAKEADTDDDMAWAQVRKIVEENLDDLIQNRLPKIAQKTGMSVDEIKKAVEKLRTLSLAPARRLVEVSERPITPDAIVEYDADNDRYYAYLNDRRLPNLQLNREYELMAKDKAVAKPTREFIKTNLSNANFLLEAIEQRQKTIKRVVDVVVAEQREFFDFGPQAIKPLPMTKVAERLGIHVATVSRAVAEKYLQTPRGVVALRKFFTGGTTTETGEEVSWDAIKAAMSEVVDGEDKSNPLSDDQIADELKKRGLEIARRTVAKYRGQLGIPTGRLRKAY